MDAAFTDVIFIDDAKDLVAEADVVLAVQAPSQTTVKAMRVGAILICYLEADAEPELLKLLCTKKIT
jgi:NAD(P) transhydrogenase subunit alpha